MRNRSEGWKYAKKGGHKLEEMLKKKIKNDPGFSSEFHFMVFGKAFNGEADASGGGKGAKKVPSVVGHLTQPKVDLTVKWKNGSTARISIKKSLGGQVWLVSLKNFLAALDGHYGIFPGKRVVEGLGLFIGAPGFKEKIDLQKPNLKGPLHRNGKSLEVHQGRLCANTIIKNLPDHWNELIEWFNINIISIADLCFSKGLCKYPEDQADVLWYFDLKQEKSLGINRTIRIKDILEKLKDLKNPCSAGEKNCGTTIQLPFGFLQMHSPGETNEMQFHHSFQKLEALL